MPARMMIAQESSALCRNATQVGGFGRVQHHKFAALTRPGRILKLQVRQQQQSDAEQIQLNPWQGNPIPTKLNNIPHERDTRRHFYSEVVVGVNQALAAGEKLITVKCTIPELNTEYDVYRVGTLLELVREIATSMAADGRSVKCCVQQPLGQGVFAGTPLSLNGIMRIMKQMDWGGVADRISLGNISAAEINDAEAFILIAPQNIVGHSVLPFLQEMSEAAAAAGKPLVLINANLKDVQSAGGVMSVRGRQGRMDYVATFIPAYTFRLLYLGASMYPVMGALRFSYGGPWQVFKRVQLEGGVEEYRLAGEFDHDPNPTEITQCFQQKR